MKLQKCSLTTQDYYWNYFHCVLGLLTPYQLNVTLNVIKHPIEFTFPNENRKFVGATVNPSNEKNHITSLFQDRLEELTTKLNSLRMSPCNVLLIYKVYC